MKKQKTNFMVCEESETESNGYSDKAETRPKAGCPPAVSSPAVLRSQESLPCLQELAGHHATPRDATPEAGMPQAV